MGRNEQDLGALMPEGKGDYAPGDTLVFIEDHVRKSGEVVHVQAPGETVSGKHHPLTYLVDTGEGFPVFVYPAQIWVEK